MKTELKEISPTRKQIDIEIEADAVRKVYDRVSDQYAKAANVPGFRPGHAPRGVVRTRFKDQIRTEVLRELLPDAVQKAIADLKLPASYSWGFSGKYKTEQSAIKNMAMVLGLAVFIVALILWLEFRSWMQVFRSRSPSRSNPSR